MTISDPPIDPPNSGSDAESISGGRPFYTFELVQERLVAAKLLWDRAPDRERGWLAVRSNWPEVVRQGWRVGVDGEHDEREEDPQPARLPLTRDQVAEMQRVSEWLGLLGDEDGKLIAYAVAALAAGRKRVPWVRLLKHFGMKRGAGALSTRYSRAVAYLAFRLNGRSDADARRLAQRRAPGWEAVMRPGSA